MSATTPPQRFDRLDALRGLAMLWMTAYHFAFDLNHLRWLQPVQDFYRDPLWTLQRTAIVSSFLFCAGLSLAVALHQGQTWPRFWRRWAQVAGCAVLVSAGSALMFPRSWISFGVLHGLAVMLLLARCLALAQARGRWPSAMLVALALAALAAPVWLQHPVFDHRATNWLGLVTRLPVTEDYVPLLPWLGVVLLGLVAGQTCLRRGRCLLQGPVPGALRPLAALGRWSLSYYMLHQPVLIGGLLAAQALFGRP
jgi:uncharacterized membrane protein